ncbi:hypothetical protein AMTRI_Chr03g139000 [Amborella trichopoda]
MLWYVYKWLSCLYPTCSLLSDNSSHQGKVLDSLPSQDLALVLVMSMKLRLDIKSAPFSSLLSRQSPNFLAA